MNKGTTVIQAKYLVPRPGELLASAAVVVEGNQIVAVEDAATCRQSRPDAQYFVFDNAIILPGLVNSHQHGRGLSQIQLGFPDDFLETWIAGRRARSPLDSGPVTRLAAARMLANGVTTAIHANYTYGTGNYEQELRDQIAAYLSVGLRHTLCVGVMDRGSLVYPPHEACFLVGIRPELRDWLLRPGNLPYCKDAPSTIDLMHRLRTDFEGESLVRLCYGPAGPQWVTDSAWKLIAEDAFKHGLGMHMHALESPAQRDAAKELYPRGVFNHLETLGAMNEKTVIAHAVWVDEADIEVIARTKATVVRSPGCNLRMRNGIAPLARYLESGVRVAVGSDNCSMQDDEDLLSELRLAGILGRESDWNGAVPPTSKDLVAMATINGAIAAQFGQQTGLLEPGRLADVAVFSLDRTNQPYLDEDMPVVDAFLARGVGADALLTMVDGKVRFHRGEYSDLMLGELEQNAVRTAYVARKPKEPMGVDLTRELRGELRNHYRSVSGTENK